MVHMRNRKHGREKTMLITRVICKSIFTGGGRAQRTFSETILSIKTTNIIRMQIFIGRYGHYTSIDLCKYCSLLKQEVNSKS